MEHTAFSSSSLVKKMLSNIANSAITVGTFMLKLNTWRVTEGMETYVERNHNNTDAEIKKTVAHCEQVLKLIK